MTIITIKGRVLMLRNNACIRIFELKTCICRRLISRSTADIDFSMTSARLRSSLSRPSRCRSCYPEINHETTRNKKCHMCTNLFQLSDMLDGYIALFREHLQENEEGDACESDSGRKKTSIVMTWDIASSSFFLFLSDSISEFKTSSCWLNNSMSPRYLIASSLRVRSRLCSSSAVSRKRRSSRSYTHRKSPRL